MRIYYFYADNILRALYKIATDRRVTYRHYPVPYPSGSNYETSATVDIAIIAEQTSTTRLP